MWQWLMLCDARVLESLGVLTDRSAVGECSGDDVDDGYPTRPDVFTLHASVHLHLQNSHQTPPPIFVNQSITLTSFTPFTSFTSNKLTGAGYRHAGPSPRALDISAECASAHSAPARCARSE